jgi:ribosomal protein S18 acetylase RimI-like enzyme
MNDGGNLTDRLAWSDGLFQFLKTGRFLAFWNAEDQGIALFVQCNAAAVFLHNAPHHMEEQLVRTDSFRKNNAVLGIHEHTSWNESRVECAAVSMSARDYGQGFEP